MEQGVRLRMLRAVRLSLMSRHMLKEVKEALLMLEQSRDEGDDDDMESGPEDLANGDNSECNDMPEYELEEGEKQVMDPDYVFCPEVHHQQLLWKFSKHLC